MLSTPTFLLRRAALVSLLLSALTSAPTRAQGPGSGGPQPDPVQPTDVPLDGGAALLVLGGAGYALRQLRLRRSA